MSETVVRVCVDSLANAANVRTARVGQMRPSGSIALGALPPSWPHDIQIISLIY